MIATFARDQTQRALAFLTDDGVERMIKRGTALDEGDRAFLHKVCGYYQDWPLEPDLEAALRFRASGLGRIGSIFASVDQYGDARLCHEAAIRAYDECDSR